MRRSLTIRAALEEMIAIGELAPGQHLDETELGKQLGVSRTPIREALIQLTSMGLVETRPRRGAIVAQIDAGQLVEMFEVMAELEAMAGRLAARRMSAAEHMRLLEVHEACRRARDDADPDQYYYRNEEFHTLIYEGSHNTFLAEQARNIHRRIAPYRRLQLRVRGRIGASFDEHDDVVRAILAGDGDKTAELLRNHVLVQGDRFADLVASLSALGAKEGGLRKA